MKNLVLIILAVLTFGLTGCVNEKKEAWISENGGVEDKYTCENGVKMHTFWHQNKLRKAVVKNRWFTPVKCKEK